VKYNDYFDERDEITRPRRKVEKPKVKKASHKHLYEKASEHLDVFKCVHCEKIRYGKN
jgi:hypothetical protein